MEGNTMHARGNEEEKEEVRGWRRRRRKGGRESVKVVEERECKRMEKS